MITVRSKANRFTSGRLLAQLRAVLTNKRNFTDLRFEVEQASRGLSAIAELLVILDYCTVFTTLYV